MPIGAPMPTYLFRCSAGHETEVRCSVADMPPKVNCQGRDEHTLARCTEEGRRVFLPPVAIHFKGPGFYSTDVRGAQQRRRRPNAADDLHRPHDPAAAKIARSL